MEYIHDIKIVYKKAFKETIDIIKKTPVTLFLTLIYSALFGLLYIIFFGTGFMGSRFAGVILGLLQAMILSSYFAQMESGINYNRINLNSVFDSLFIYLWNIYFMRFVFYVLSMFLWQLMSLKIVVIISFIIFNAAGEAIYLRNVGNFGVFTYPANYLKENWHLWIPHLLILIFVFNRFISLVNINPLEMYLHPIVHLDVSRIIMLIILGFYFIFRGVLFKNTIASSMRKRKYMESTL